MTLPAQHDASENGLSSTKDMVTVLPGPGQPQLHTKSDQDLSNTSLCVQHASAFIWEPFLLFVQYHTPCCRTGSLGREVGMGKGSGGGGLGVRMENTDKMEKARGTGKGQCCPELLQWLAAAAAERAAKPQQGTRFSGTRAFPSLHAHFFAHSRRS